MNIRTVISSAALIAAGAAAAEPLDYFGPPPAEDPSAWSGPIVNDSMAADLELLDPVYKGAIEGGPTQTAADQGVNGAIAEDQLQSNGKYDVPTNSRPSPLFGAQPFVQKMLRFEEFGTRPLDPTAPAPVLEFPRPTLGPLPVQDPASVASSSPDPLALEAFLAQPGIAPFPQEFSNVHASNPWQQDI